MRSPGFLRSKDNEEDGKHASFNFANVYNESARDLLGKEINVFWKLFDGPYREMMRQRNIEYAHTITRFVSAEDFKYNSEEREFVTATFEGRRESGVTAQDYWMCGDSYAQEGEILHCWYAFTLMQLKKWGNSIQEQKCFAMPVKCIYVERVQSCGKGTLRKRHSLYLGITIGRLLPTQTKVVSFLCFPFQTRCSCIPLPVKEHHAYVASMLSHALDFQKSFVSLFNMNVP